MMAFFWIIEGVATYCESFVCYYLGNALFDNEGLRKHGWKLAAVLTSFILLLNHVRLFTIFTLLFAVLFVSLTEHIIFKIKFIEALEVAGVYVVFLNIIDSFSNSLLGVLWDDSAFLANIISGFSMQRVVSILVSKAILVLLYLLLKRFTRKFLPVIRTRKTFAIIIGGILGWGCLRNLSIKSISISTTINWAMFFFVVCTVCCILYVSICYRDEKNSRSFIQFYNSVFTEQYRELMKSYEKNSKKFHDMQNHMLAIKCLLEKHEISRAQEYVKALTDTNDFLETSWTGNEIMDHILNIKKLKAEEAQINFTIDADIIRYQKLNDQVLCIVLANLLDNAIEANCRISTGERVICVVIRSINDMLAIKIINAAEKPKRQGNILMTAKSDSERHGWGLKSVEEAVKSHDGEISWKFEQKRFIVNIIFV